MMEEVSDDTNGESTFEFVGGKSDEASVSLAQQAHSNTSEPLPPPVPPLQSSTVLTTAITNPLTATLPHPPVSMLPPPAEPYIPPLGQHSFSSPIPHATATGPLPSSISPLQPIPMFSTIPPTTGAPSPYMTSVSSSFPPATSGGTASIAFYQPSSVSTEGGSIPIQTPPQSSYIPSSVSPLSATLDLPIEESYGSNSPQQSSQPGGTGGVWGWIKGNDFLSKVAEKAKNSVDTMITTLDPGMKEFIYSGGDIDIIVASDKEIKVSSIREAFQQTFGRATVHGLAAQATNIAAQPIGFSAGVKAAEERISYLRQHGMVHEHQTVVAVENFLAELTPEKWFDLGCLLLHDPKTGLHLQVYTQPTPVPTYFVLQAQDQTPSDYPFKWSGLAITTGQVVGAGLGVSHKEWHQALTGVDRKEMVLMAARSLAGMYKVQSRR